MDSLYNLDSQVTTCRWLWVCVGLGLVAVMRGECVLVNGDGSEVCPNPRGRRLRRGLGWTWHFEEMCMMRGQLVICLHLAMFIGGNPAWVGGTLRC